MFPFGLGTAREGADLVAGFEREGDQAGADEAGAAGKGDGGHSSAIWLRCTSVERGA